MRKRAHDGPQPQRDRTTRNGEIVGKVEAALREHGFSDAAIKLIPQIYDAKGAADAQIAKENRIFEAHHTRLTRILEGQVRQHEQIHTSLAWKAPSRTRLEAPRLTTGAKRKAANIAVCTGIETCGKRYGASANSPNAIEWQLLSDHAAFCRKLTKHIDDAQRQAVAPFERTLKNSPLGEHLRTKGSIASLMHHDLELSDEAIAVFMERTMGRPITDANVQKFAAAVRQARYQSQK
jgi:hypothetical protein